MRSIEGQPGWELDLPVDFQANGARIAAIDHNLFFDPRNAPMAEQTRGKPDCWVNSATGMQGYFAFWPDGCWQWPESCDMVTALIINLSNPNAIIPDGRLYTCRVKVSPLAAPGDYLVESDYALAATVDDAEVTPQHFGGSVRVVAPPGGSGPTCAVGTGGQGSLLAMALPGLLWARRLSRTRPAPKLVWAALAVGIVLLLWPQRLTLSQSAPEGRPSQVFDVGGSVREAGSVGSGLFEGVITVFPNGSISGSVRVEVNGRTELLNISARLERGFVRLGRAYGPAGELKGAFVGSRATEQTYSSLTQPGGSLRLRDGTRYFWTLERLQARTKLLSPEVIDALTRGEATRVIVHLDTYPVDREIRLQYRDKIGPSWVRRADSEAASRLKRELLEGRHAALLAELRAKGVAVSLPPLRPSYSLPEPVKAVFNSFADLQRVLDSPLVHSVIIDRDWRIKPLLDQSLPLIRQPEVAGFLRGGGTSIAILDTGLWWCDFIGRLLFGEACQYGPGAPNCRVLLTKDFFRGSGRGWENLCRDNAFQLFHGTYVAGIAGSVAAEAGLIGLLVLDCTATQTCLCNGPDCEPDTSAFERVYDALDWVVGNARVFNIAAVNLSFELYPTDGSSKLRSQPCTESGDLVSRVRDLWAKGVIPVAASGNDGRTVARPPHCKTRHLRCHPLPLGEGGPKARVRAGDLSL